MEWHEIAPIDATSIDLSLPEYAHISAPLNEMGERCPWPWDPQQLIGAPLGQYHCGYCGAMVVAGMPHLDYSPCPNCGREYDDLECRCREDRDETN